MYLPVQRLIARCCLGALLLGIACAASVHAATHVVTQCGDSGPGSLRAAAATAASGDAIDLTRLSCTRITLTSGQLVLPQEDISLVGPGRSLLTIDGGQQGRVIAHEGHGTLYLYRLSFANGRVEVAGPDYIAGGCLQSQGALWLVRSRVHRCRLWVDHRDINTSAALGGAIYAREVHVSYSSVAYSTAGHFGRGGGIFGSIVSVYRSQVYGNTALTAGGGIDGAIVSASYSLIHGNRATIGGGITATEITLNKTTVSANLATGPVELGWISNRGGGVFAGASGVRHYIVDSTFSGNVAHQYGAANLNGRTVMFNTTITENVDTGTQNSAGVVGCWDAGA